LSEEVIKRIKDGYEEFLDEKTTAALKLTDQIIGAPGAPENESIVSIERNLTREERAEVSLGVGLFLGMSKVLIALGLEPEEMETTVVLTPGSDAKNS
tara:strand:+ start:724 stop:1017 length:294 start_codon:yes stop_codon:yes gene_type:complete